MALSVLPLPEVTEEQTLGDEKAESILFRKMEAVEREVGDVRQNAAEILIQIKHLSDGHSDIKKLIESIESVMFGHNVDVGLMTRISILELNEQNRVKADWNRTVLIRCLWVAVAGLVLEVIVRGFFFGAG